MTNLNISAKSIKGLLPALDRRVIEQPFVMSGRNFSFSAEGPLAAFGARFFTPYPLENPEGFATFVVEDDTFLFTNDAIYKFDFTSKMLVPQFFFSGLTGTEPWSFAFIGGKYYFCRADVGLLEYIASTLTWTVITTDVPAGAKYITASEGRLVVLGDTSYSWSALDDGTDLAPSLITGAGNQSTAILGGTTLACGAYGSGFLVYTDEGVIRAVFTGGTSPFRHRTMTRRRKLLNKYSLLNIDNEEHIIITNLGLFTTKGTGFADFDPVFNQFMQDFVKTFDEARQDALRLFYDEPNDVVYLSQSAVVDSSIYNEAFVVDRALGNWGQFNRTHYGFGEIFFASGPETGFHLFYIGDDGYLRFFGGSIDVESPPVIDGVRALMHEEEVQFPTFVNSTTGKITMSSVGHMQSFDEGVFGVLYEPGWYNVTILSEETGWLLLEDDASALLLEDDASFLLLPDTITTVIAQIDEILAALDSLVVLGLFRYTEQQYPDEIGLVTNLAIGAGNTPVGQTEEDWNIIEGAEDWNVIVGEEDWGSGIVSAEVYTATLESTDDGFAISDNQSNVIDDLVYDNDGATAYYGVYQSGVWHNIQLGAIDDGQSFHLKFLELSGSIGGRI